MKPKITSSKEKPNPIKNNKSVQKIIKKPSLDKKIIPTSKIIKKEQIKMPKIIPNIPKSKKPIIKPQNNNFTWSNLPIYFYHQIFQYSCKTIWDVLKISHVCKSWKYVIQNEQSGLVIWQFIKLKNPIKNFKQFKNHCKQIWLNNIIKSYEDYQKIFTRLFDYGSTKQNIPNKLLAKLDIEINLTLNKKQFLKIPYKLRNFNFSSYLVIKVTQINALKFDFNTPHNLFKDKIDFQLNFLSRRYRTKFVIKKSYFPEEIYERSIRQKAFNYYLDKNFVFTFFEGDNHFIYFLAEYSAIQLVNAFRKQIKKEQKEKKLILQKMKLLKRLCETEFQSFIQYLKYQADFEVHFSFHNSEKQIFTHCDTKVYPISYNQKVAYFELQVKDSFPIQKTFKLDNKMGMSQSVQNLYLLDFVLKDRDKFLITFSGFIYAKQLTQEQKQKLENFLQYSQVKVFELNYKFDNYRFEIYIIEEKSRYFMPSLKIQLYPEQIK